MKSFLGNFCGHLATGHTGHAIVRLLLQQFWRCPFTNDGLCRYKPSWSLRYESGFKWLCHGALYWEEMKAHVSPSGKPWSSMASCCIYEIPKNKDRFFTDNIQIYLTIWQIRAFVLLNKRTPRRSRPLKAIIKNWTKRPNNERGLHSFALTGANLLNKLLSNIITLK